MGWLPPRHISDRQHPNSNPLLNSKEILPSYSVSQGRHHQPNSPAIRENPEYEVIISLDR